MHAVPPPFRSFAVRSDEATHRALARAPYGRVHGVQTGLLDERSRVALVAEGDARLRIASVGEIEHARTTPQRLCALAPHLSDLAQGLAGALQLTGVLGDDGLRYRRQLETRIDFLGARGAGFHNDVGRHWPRCLFWLLVLDLADVAFVMPHAGVQVLLAPGDLLVFDPSMAHGLCRPRDDGQALPRSFDGVSADRQLFLTGELLLDDDDWAALRSPWLPLAVHAARAALDLRLAVFDDRTGTIQRVHTLRDGMSNAVDGADD